MRAYFQLFFNLLVPLGGLFIFISVIYFKSEYNFTQALRLGVLSGFFIAIVASFFTALFLLILRRVQKSQKDVLKKRKFDIKTIKQKIMLLMDRELAFEIALYAISEQNIGTLTKSVAGGDHITVKNNDEIIQLTFSSLTRHTSQVVIVSEINSNATKKMINYMKEKEHSFLQY